MDGIDAIIKEFVVESRENLDRLDRDLIELEKNPSGKERLASIFRAIHSIKGATGFLGFTKLGTVAHVGEGLLGRLRDGTLIINAPITSGLLALVDYMHRLLLNIDQGGAEGDEDCSALVDNLTRLQEQSAVSTARSSSPDSPGTLSSLAVGEDERHTRTTGEIKPPPDGANGRTTYNETADKPHDRMETDRASPVNSSVRVEVKQLDKLMNLAGELVLTRNELIQFSSLQQNTTLLGTSQRLNAITTELQDEIMKVRMQPIENVWNKFPRLVRDLALSGGKKARLELQGKETELDKTLLEAITDPLTHLVRNAVDHGLETPETRAAAGKPAEGRILLRASHEGGQVEIEVSDDGSGIDVARVKEKAVERGLIAPEQARVLSDAEAMNLLFFPGFSTIEQVTTISGRGVGMDVVKTNIEKIGGEVSVESQLGSGTLVRIKIPLTLAIMPALVVTAGGHRYAIPQLSILELVRLEGQKSKRGIEKIQNASVYRLRGDLLPLIWLDVELGTRHEKAPWPSAEDVINIVVLQAADRKFGLVVNEINDTQEIVVKPLEKRLREMPLFAGATLMANGEVVLILDVLGIAVHAHAIPELNREKAIKTSVAFLEPVARQTLLLFAGPDDSRMAVPLSQVMRLEEFLTSSLEYTADQLVVQYRGDILPLVSISTLLIERRAQQRNPYKASEQDKTIQAIVYSKDCYRVGLVVDEIIGTVEQSMLDLRPPSRTGVVASAVVGGRVTEILDLESICSALTFPSFQGVAGTSKVLTHG